MLTSLYTVRGCHLRISGWRVASTSEAVKPSPTLACEAVDALGDVWVGISGWKKDWMEGALGDMPMIWLSLIKRDLGSFQITGQ